MKTTKKLDQQLDQLAQRHKQTQLVMALLEKVPAPVASQVAIRQLATPEQVAAALQCIAEYLIESADAAGDDDGDLLDAAALAAKAAQRLDATLSPDLYYRATYRK